MSPATSVQELQHGTTQLKSSLNTLRQDTLRLFSELQDSVEHARTSINQEIDKIAAGRWSGDVIIPFKSIGTFRSCFLTKNGTPRQSGICPYARGSLKITCFNNPAHSLEHLTQFSHVWLIFLFHQNGGNHVPKAKVSPPRLNGEKVGVFASRSPHRPNNVGMSLVKLDRVAGGTIFVSGVDLIDGTPILDLKPYISEYDTSPTPSTSPTWISNPPTDPLSVEFTDTALTQMSNLNYAPNEVTGTSHRGLGGKDCLRFIRNESELRQSITDIISADPRSVYRKRQSNTTFSFPIDSVDVEVEVKGEVVKILNVAHSDYVRNLLKQTGT